MRWVVVLCLALSACVSDDVDAPIVAPTRIGPIRVWFLDTFGATTVVGDTIRATVRNSGASGQFRVRLYDDARGPFSSQPPSPRLRCTIGPLLLNLNVEREVVMPCPGAVILWAVIESQDGSSPAWVRTSCLGVPRIGFNPTCLPSMAAER